MLSGRHGWESESVIEAPWEDVMRSVQNKYPNPYNNNVLNIDVVNRKIDEQTGVMHSIRLLNTCWSTFPNLGQLKALEWSAIDGKRKHMVAVSHNMDLRGVSKAVEHMEYSVHPENDRWTLVKHSVSIEAFPLLGRVLSSSSRELANQGLEAIEWVMKHRLPLLHSCPHWNVNLPQRDFAKPVSDPPAMEQPPASSMVHPPVLPVSQSDVWNWKNSVFSFFRRQNSSPTVERHSVPEHVARPEPTFFREPAVTPSRAQSASEDLDNSPIIRLGSHFESISRDVTAMSSALVRRTQRVARLFSRIDEYVVIM